MSCGTDSGFRKSRTDAWMLLWMKQLPWLSKSDVQVTGGGEQEPG